MTFGWDFVTFGCQEPLGQRRKTGMTLQLFCSDVKGKTWLSQKLAEGAAQNS